MWLEHLVANTINALRSPGGNIPQSGLVIGTLAENPAAKVKWPDSRRCEHAVLLGKTGTGKTYLLESLAWQIAQLGEGFCLIDFHGDASRSLISRLRTLPDAGQRLVILDPSHPTRSPGINVLASGVDEAGRFRKVSEIAAILRARWGVDAFGARTEELLRNSLYTLAARGATLADLPALLTDDEFRGRCTRGLDQHEVASYWTSRYEPLSEAMKAAFREPLLNRTTAFLTEPAARHLLSQPTSTVDIASVMAKAQWLIVRLPKGQLREHAHTLGNLLFAQLQFAALARESIRRSARRTFTLLCDEVQNLAENDLATLLTEGRKFGISVITANQFFEQLPVELRGALLSAASHLCFRLSSRDAQVLAGELSLDGKRRLASLLTQLPRGEAVGRLGGLAVHVRIPRLPAVPMIGSADLDRLIEGVTKDRAQIDAEHRSRRQSPASPLRIVRANSIREGHHEW